MGTSYHTRPDHLETRRQKLVDYVITLYLPRYYISTLCSRYKVECKPALCGRGEHTFQLFPMADDNFDPDPILLYGEIVHYIWKELLSRDDRTHLLAEKLLRCFNYYRVKNRIEPMIHLGAERRL